MRPCVNQARPRPRPRAEQVGQDLDALLRNIDAMVSERAKLEEQLAELAAYDAAGVDDADEAGAAAARAIEVGSTRADSAAMGRLLPGRGGGGGGDDTVGRSEARDPVPRAHSGFVARVSGPIAAAAAAAAVQPAHRLPSSGAGSAGEAVPARVREYRLPPAPATAQARPAPSSTAVASAKARLPLVRGGEPADAAHALASDDEPRVFEYGGRDVGARVRIHNSRYGEWYEGTITAFDAHRGMHMVVYASGERKWHVMRDKKFEVISWPGAGAARAGGGGWRCGRAMCGECTTLVAIQTAQLPHLCRARDLPRPRRAAVALTSSVTTRRTCMAKGVAARR